jgi:hypothetical protein
MMIPQPLGGTMETIARPWLNQTRTGAEHRDRQSHRGQWHHSETLARATPDGYTRLTSASLANNDFVHKKPDNFRRFLPVTLVTILPGYPSPQSAFANAE